MTTKAQKIRVGLFTAIFGALAAIVVVVFGGMRFWEGRHSYNVVFEDSVYGLEEGAHVYLNGMRVGSVDSVEPDPTDLKKVRVKINVKEGTPVREDTRAMLQLAGITGLKVIDLRGGSLATAMLPPDSTILAGETTLDKLEKQAQTLADQSTQLMHRATQIVDNLVAVTDPKQFEGMAQIVQQAKRTADNLAATSDTLHKMVDENRVAIRHSIDAVGETARNASTMLDGQVTLLVANAGDFISQLKGIVNNNEGALRSAVFDLRQASRSFKELAREVRQKPSRLLFSKSPSERKLP